jgi:hypothetical protein
MPEVSDIELMELADGTLAEPRRRIVETELAGRPDLQERLEVFRVTGKALARLFDPVVEASVPPRLLETIEHAGPAPSQRVLHFASGTERATRQKRFAGGLPVAGWAFPSGIALAAGLVAVVALGTAIWSLQPLQPSEVSGRLAAAPLALALDKTPSAQTAGLVLAGRGPGVLKPDLSFLHVDGRYCRQYELSFETGNGLAAYACTAGDGRWHIEKEAEMTPVRTNEPNAIRPAGESGVKIIDDAVGTVIRGDVLEPDRELALIHRGWSSEGNR